MCGNGQDVLMPLPPKACERVGKIGLSWFLEGSRIDSVRSFVAVARSSQIDWTGLSLLDKLFTYLWETLKAVDSPEVHSNVLCKCPPDASVSFGRIELPAHTVGIGMDQLLSMDEELVRSFGPEFASVWPLMRRAVTLATTNSQPVLMMTMPKTRTL